ncbi:lysophospholipid acyltransferase family protein [Williamsia sterculiae]|uniref:1-acyl-sn-glycerol-3-phosphate acyltransferase n=1 Tax=Williamsia sterculiae TaxID=1344003 RepID=A0A1N7FK73_9NOCA|nr:lysophospholipid acyltransferase family protein [Williamsia sterculiae]SIS00677.1 1-acyl-sn-glycerol-3-phosphate acyltransferase [Williamsia sterculiae]
MWYLLFKHVLIGPPLRRWVQVSRSGAQLPTGPVILASNHLAEIDSLIVPLVVSRRVTFLAKSEYFTGRGIRGHCVRWFFTAVGQIPVDRCGGDDGPLDAACAVLRGGGVWAVYPEGTRSPDGRMHRGHTGVMRVAARCPDAALIPIAVMGTDELNPPQGRRIRRGRCRVVIGEPVAAQRWIAESGIRGATDRLMTAIAELSGQERADGYAR